MNYRAEILVDGKLSVAGLYDCNNDNKAIISANKRFRENLISVYTLRSDGSIETIWSIFNAQT